MSTEKEKLQKLNTIEEGMYILDYLIEREEDLLHDLQYAPPSPKQPKKPNSSICDLPPYNEKEYLVKAKKAEHAKYSKFRENCVVCGFVLMGTLIGILICWVPWVVALCSYPFQVSGRRKAAYSIYRRECEKLLEQNSKSRREMLEYEAILEKYQSYCKKLQAQKAVLPFQEHWLSEQINKVTTKRESLRKERNSLYYDLNIPSQLQEPKSAIMLLHYIESKNAFSISDALELYKRSGIEILTLYELNESKDIYISMYPNLINAIEKRQHLAEELFNDFRNNINNLKENSINPITTDFQVKSLEKVYTSY